MSDSSLQEHAHNAQSQGLWKQFVGTVRSTYGDAAGDRMATFRGDIEQATGWLQEQYGDAAEKLADYRS